MFLKSDKLSETIGLCKFILKHFTNRTLLLKCFGNINNIFVFNVKSFVKISC